MEVSCSEFICELGVCVGGWVLPSLMRNCLFPPWDVWVQGAAPTLPALGGLREANSWQHIGVFLFIWGLLFGYNVGIDKGCCSLAGLCVSMSHAGQKQPHVLTIHFRTEFP